ncbi:MAG: 3-hydroxybutyryl-CoA dehydrogenase [Actinobacteria bacterium]|nr:3-hydroxybutyryl-CoA dehydrogenase [Actinomycetota bacterium]
MKVDDIKTIGVCGAGTMGAGIVQLAAQSGFNVKVIDVQEAFIQRGMSIITKNLGRLLSKERISQADHDAIMGRISASTDATVMADADFVIEAILEEVEAKKALFAQLEAVCRPDVVFATNTSSISVTQLAGVSARPDRIVGMHFFNPVPVMKLVEIIPALQTKAEAVDLTIELTKKLGRTPVPCKDTPSFIVNRILVPMIIDAVRVYDSGVATAADIDTAMKLGANLPMGPLELADFVGLDIVYHIGNMLFEYTKEARFNPPDLLRNMVQAGWLGRKTGKGFYDYAERT